MMIGVHARTMRRRGRVGVLFAAAIGMLGAGWTVGTARGVDITMQRLLVDVRELASPAAPGGQSAALTTGPDGTVSLSWLEKSAAGGAALKFARLDEDGKAWGAAQLIAQGADLVADGADVPSLAVADAGRMMAAWTAGPRCVWSRSIDAGATWSVPQTLSRESDATGFAALVALTDGRFLAAWLDNRTAPADVGRRRLFARIVGGAGPDQLVDAAAAGGCPLALVAFPDGSASVAYRARRDGEVSDSFAARFDGDRWEEPRLIGREGWKNPAAPADGPRIVADGPRMSAVWFSAADDEPRVLAATSPDAGALWTMAQRADLGRPAGRADTVQTRDGSQYVLWLEGRGEDDSQPAGLYLRRYNGYGGGMIPARLAPTPPAAISGFPRLALAREDDSAGPAQLVVAFAEAGPPTRLRTLLVPLPSTGELIEIDNDCACSAGKEIARGYAVKGRILSVDTVRHAVRLWHEPIPGLMRAGELDVRVAPAMAAALRAEGGFLARLEKRGGEWWIFDVRLMVGR